jgi:hypothetical protein
MKHFDNLFKYNASASCRHRGIQLQKQKKEKRSPKDTLIALHVV